MRKKNREITDRDEMIRIMRKCDACRIALNDESGFPYIIPLNFGLRVSEDGEITLIFHSALEGYKLDLIRKDNRASFEMDCGHQLQYFKDKGYCTMAYESIMGKGMIRIFNEEEKVQALQEIMDQYHPGQHAPFNPEAISRTTVYGLTVKEMSGKRKLPKIG